MSDFVLSPFVEGPEFTRNDLNLADGSLGAVVTQVSDEFFAPRDRLLNPESARFYPDRFDDHGKWMDGWETRRRRNTGHDFCVIRLAMPGVLSGVDFDTSFFTGNYPPAAALEACWSPHGEPGERADWVEILPTQILGGNQHHFHAILNDGPWTHLRLHIYPDGGMARFRVYGRPHCDWAQVDVENPVDLLALAHGGDQIAWSDAHYGEPRKMLRPGRGVNMGDGWETRRRREPGNDWCILRLGHPGLVASVEVDTAHFKGNFPARCSIQAARIERATRPSLVAQSQFWPILLEEQPLSADAIHTFVVDHVFGPITHIRFNMIPDGGVSRLRLWGKPQR
jgi:allantoicase